MKKLYSITILICSFVVANSQTTPTIFRNTTEAVAVPILKLSSGTGTVAGSGGSIEFYKGTEAHFMGRIYTVNTYSNWASSTGKLILSSYYTSYKDELTLYNGNIGIGNTNPLVKLDILVDGNLGTISGNYKSLTRISGSVPTNTFMVNDFYYREGSGNDWTSTSYIRGISVDNSFLVPGTTLKSWIKQKPVDDRIEFGSSGSTYMSIIGGNVGIGVTNPSLKLEVSGSSLINGGYLFVNAESAGKLRVGAAWGMPGIYSGEDGNKDLTIGVPVGRKVYLGNSTGDAYLEGGTGNAYFKGNVGIGTNDTKGYKLAVAGGAGIVAEKFVVKKQVNWPDFVFEKDYQLTSLQSIEEYVILKKHLPDVPSSEEVEKGGLDLGSTQAILLKKIEELTLYLINQDKKIKKLEMQVNNISQ